jgi:hypothetical protein
MLLIVPGEESIAELSESRYAASGASKSSNYYIWGPLAAPLNRCAVTGPQFEFA